MGFLGNLLGGGKAVGEAAQGIGTAISTVATGIRTAITGVDPAKAAELEKLALEADQAVQLAQAAINETEAKSPSLFVAGWRPGLGWVFVLVIAFHYLVRPIAQWVLTLVGNPMILPSFALNEIWPVLIGILGLGTLRTVEKNQDAQGNH